MPGGKPRPQLGERIGGLTRVAVMAHELSFELVAQSDRDVAHGVRGIAPGEPLTART